MSKHWTLTRSEVIADRARGRQTSGRWISIGPAGGRLTLQAEIDLPGAGQSPYIDT